MDLKMTVVTDGGRYSKVVVSSGLTVCPCYKIVFFVSSPIHLNVYEAHIQNFIVLCEIISGGYTKLNRYVIFCNYYVLQKFT